MGDETLRKYLSSTFKLCGFSLRSDARNYLASQLLPVTENEQEQWLEKITDHVQRQGPTNSIVEILHIETAIKECLRFGLDETETAFNVISAFEVPRFKYILEKKKFMKVTKADSDPEPQLLALPPAISQMYRNRYTVLHQRTSRHSMFAPTEMGPSSDTDVTFQLRPVEYFLSSSGRVQRSVVLAMLTQLKEGKFYLEDPSGVMQLDLSQTTYHLGLYTENCFVLCDGWYEDRIFHAEAIGFPPPEVAKTSRIYFGNMNTFGGPSATSLTLSARLLSMEKDRREGMIVFVSDLWLDSVKVVAKLEALLSGYADFPPAAVVLLGNFLSTQAGSTSAHLLRTHLDSLAEVLAESPVAGETTFVLVPGPTDPMAPNVLPRPPLPPFVTEGLRRRVPSVVLASSPCRIQYCTQEIVVIREDLVTKMCRNTIHFPTEGEIPEHFARTIVSQGHLTPLPLSVCPVYWGFDHALSLYPLPDVVVVADQFKAFATSTLGCQVVNPGSFPKSGFSFLVYNPCTRLMDASQIPDDD